MPGDAMPSAAESDGRLATASPQRYGKWVTAGAWVLLVSCLAGSLAIATAWRSIVDRSAQRQFEATAADISTVVSSALQRNVDFMAALQTTLASRPQMTNPELASWIRGVAATRRYPGGVGYGFVQKVPAAELPAFRRQVLADPPSTAMEPGRFEIQPKGRRAVYCPIRLVTVTVRMPIQIPTIDFCALDSIPGVTSAAPSKELQAVADRGNFAAIRLEMFYGLFAIVAPVYAGDTTPATLADRRAKLEGWVIGMFEPASVLATSLRSHPGMHVEILHRNFGDARLVTMAEGGTMPERRRTYETSVEAEGPWTVRVCESRRASGISADGQFAVVLAMGTLLSVLIFGFIEVLAHSRVRALRLVARRTEQLRHQASHDSLTGLPNRACTLGQVEAALARAREHARRDDDAIALMFLDLDEFKTINDTYGHPSGDELLREVATRLRGALRDDDVVGRLGGDEFVVLLQGSSLEEGPEAVAERIGTVLAEPLRLHGRLPVTVQVRASIGIALGVRADADEMLRDADMALYEAKHQGKDRYVVYRPHSHAWQPHGSA